jgi:hypothetical protein
MASLQEEVDALRTDNHSLGEHLAVVTMQASKVRVGRTDSTHKRSRLLFALLCTGEPQVPSSRLLGSPFLTSCARCLLESVSGCAGCLQAG